MSNISRKFKAINKPMTTVKNEAVKAFNEVKDSKISESVKTFVHKSHAKILKTKCKKKPNHPLRLPAMFKSGIDHALVMRESYPKKSCLKGASSTQPAWTPIKKVEFTQNTADPVPTAVSHSLKRALFGQSNIPCVADQAAEQPATASQNTALPAKGCLRTRSAYPEEPLTGKRMKSVRFLDSRRERVYFEPDAYESDTCSDGDDDDDEPPPPDPLMFPQEDLLVDRNINDAEANRDKYHLMASENMAFKILVKKTPEEREQRRVAQINRRRWMLLRR